MKDKDLTETLASCLDSVLHGEKSIEECAEAFPKYKSELSELLTMAQVLQQYDKSEIAEARDQVESKLFPRIRALQEPASASPQTQPALHQRVREKILHFRITNMRNFIIKIAAVLLLGFLLTEGTLQASAASLPGDTLYPVKRASESFQLFMTFDPLARIHLELNFASERIHEAESLENKGNENLAQQTLTEAQQDIQQAQVNDQQDSQPQSTDQPIQQSIVNLQNQYQQESQNIQQKNVKKSLPDATPGSTATASTGNSENSGNSSQNKQPMPTATSIIQLPTAIPTLPPVLNIP